MPAKPSGEIKTSTIHQTQKNGDIYVLERKTQYDPEKKYNRVLSTKLIAKIPKGETIPVATRPKRNKNSKSDAKNEIVTAKRKHIGMMDIIDYIGSVSGIDDAVYASTDLWQDISWPLTGNLFRVYSPGSITIRSHMKMVYLKMSTITFSFRLVWTKPFSRIISVNAVNPCQKAMRSRMIPRLYLLTQKIRRMQGMVLTRRMMG